MVMGKYRLYKIIIMVRLFLMLSSSNHALGSRSYSTNLGAMWTHSLHPSARTQAFHVQ